MNLNVTHFFRRTPDRDDWVPLPFVTRKMNDPQGAYYFGFETFRELPPKAIVKQLSDGTLKPLSWSISISPGQSLWLTPENEIYIASEIDPIGDHNKLMVDLAYNAFPILEDSWNTGDAFRKLMRSQVTRSVFMRGEFNYVFGDYLASRRSPSIERIYCPDWQDKVLTSAKLDLERATRTYGHASKLLKLKRWQAQEHRYPHIEELIVDDNLPIHWEMIFKTRKRKRVVDVIHLANVHKLALVSVRDSLAQNQLKLDGDKLFARHSDEWLRKLKETKTEICAPTDQSSDHLLLHAITKWKLNPDYKTERSTAREWKEWILEAPKKNKRIFVCDIGIAHRLKATCADQAELIISFVPYDVPIPVGIAHKKDDPIWRNFLLREIKKVSKSTVAKIKTSFDDTKDRCKELGMNWVWRN